MKPELFASTNIIWQLKLDQEVTSAAWLLQSIWPKLSVQKTTSIRIWAAHHTYLQILTGLKNSKKNREAVDNTSEDELIYRLIKMSDLNLKLFQICCGIPSENKWSGSSLCYKNMWEWRESGECPEITLPLLIVLKHEAVCVWAYLAWWRYHPRI